MKFTYEPFPFMYLQNKPKSCGLPGNKNDEALISRRNPPKNSQSEITVRDFKSASKMCTDTGPAYCITWSSLTPWWSLRELLAWLGVWRSKISWASSTMKYYYPKIVASLWTFQLTCQPGIALSQMRKEMMMMERKRKEERTSIISYVWSWTLQLNDT